MVLTSRRYPDLRRLRSFAAILTDPSTQGHRGPNHYPGPWRTEEIPGLWLHLPQLPSFRPGDAVIVRRVDSLPVQRFRADGSGPPDDFEPHGGYAVGTGRGYSER